MRFQTQVDVDADTETVWRVLINVEAWPKWTASMTSVQRLQSGEFGVGSSARVVQPKLKAAVYTVTECEMGRSFTWEMKAAGVTVRAGHLIEDLGQGKARVTLSIEQSGLLSGIVDMLFGKRTRQYVAMETRGLKNAAEALAAGTDS
jgi:uncharacterized membrane protein